MSPPPLRAGVGLKPDHYRAALEAGGGDPPSSTDDLEGFWLEVHPENYMTPGGPRLPWLDAIAARWPVSLHGVGASLGGAEPVDAGHLECLKALVDRVRPALVSEHVAWSGWGGTYFADLLPLPATREALDRLVANIDQMQTALGRPILIENPALYLSLHGDLEEPELLVEACRRTGCGLLLDVNNVFVSATNLGRDPVAYLDAIPADLVGEIHLAGHAPDARLGDALLIDSHGAPVAEAVWRLYEHALARLGPKPTLIERDANLPPFPELMAERGRAQDLLSEHVEPLHPRAATTGARVVEATISVGGARRTPPPLEGEGAGGRGARDARPGRPREAGRLASSASRSRSSPPPRPLAPSPRGGGGVESLPRLKVAEGSELAAFQGRFAAGLLQGEPPAEAARDADWRARYAVYQNNVVTALADALVKSFPAVERLVGADFMRAAAAAFVRAHPPTERALTLAGEGFAEFLRTFAAARGMPYLADVAAMDRAWLEAMFAAESPALGASALDALEPASVAALAPGLVASARIVGSPFPAHTIWRANREGDPPGRIRLDVEGETALFWRAGEPRVRHRALATGEAAFARALGAGATLAAAGGTALAADPGFDVTATFAGFLAAGVLARPTELKDASS